MAQEEEDTSLADPGEVVTAHGNKLRLQACTCTPVLMPSPQITPGGHQFSVFLESGWQSSAQGISEDAGRWDLAGTWSKHKSLPCSAALVGNSIPKLMFYLQHHPQATPGSPKRPGSSYEKE